MRLVAVGDNITDCYPEAGLMFPGGNCVNVAVHAARAGATAAYLGAVGDDSRGRNLLEALVTEGVDASRLRTQPGPTGYATVLHVDGERAFGAYDRGAARFELQAADRDFIASYDVAHSSYSAELEWEIPLLAARVPVSFDFDSHTGDDYAKELMPHVTHAFFSASHLSEGEAADLVSWACLHGARTALATRGAAGAVFFDGATLTRQPAERTQVEDTLGAGDAFIAHTLAGLLAGHPPSAFLPLAARQASEVCSALGAFGHPVPISTDLPFDLPSLDLPFHLTTKDLA